MPSRPCKGLFAWIGAHVLGSRTAVSLQQSGSGDKLFDWVQSFSLLLIAVIVTAVWSFVARERQHHARLYAWFRLFARFALGTTLISYGISKAVPLQMPILALARLVEPFGNFSPMGVLWYSVGAAPAYEIITGCAELTAGVLLFWPRTATLGALMALMDMTMVFILNMTYDVPVKLFSFHMVVLSLVLIAPNAKRLFDLFVLHRATAIPDEPSFGRSPATNRNAIIAQVVFGAYAMSVNAYQAVDGWTKFGAGAPKSALFGIWDVTDMTIDGQPRARAAHGSRSFPSGHLSAAGVRDDSAEDGRYVQALRCRDRHHEADDRTDGDRLHQGEGIAHLSTRAESAAHARTCSWMER